MYNSTNRPTAVYTSDTLSAKGSSHDDVVVSFLGTANVYGGGGEQKQKLDASVCYRRGFDLWHI
jgi:hypothetical protein